MINGIDKRKLKTHEFLELFDKNYHSGYASISKFKDFCKQKRIVSKDHVVS